jgi:hypothetical protein
MRALLVCFYTALFSSIYISNDGGSKWTDIYSNATLSEDFTPNRTMGTQCHPTPHYVTYQSAEILYINSTSKWNASIASISDPLAVAPVIEPSNKYSNYYEIQYTCNLSYQGWSRVAVQLTAENETVKIEIIKMCQTPGSFDMGYVILNGVVLIALLVSIVKGYTLSEGHMASERVENTIDTRFVLFILILGSMTLMSLFFLTSVTTIVLTAIISFSSVYSIAGALQTLIEIYLKKYNWSKKSVNIPMHGPVLVFDILSFILAGCLVGSYLLTKNWILNNLIALCLVYMFLQGISIPKLKIGALLFVVFMIYDIFWVFVSDYIFTKSVMVTVATSVDLPIKLCMPHLGALPLKHCSIIGLGDLIFPGLVMSYASNYGLKKSPSSYYVASIIL